MLQEKNMADIGPKRHPFADATVDTAFKLMLSPSINEDKTVLISFLNSFVPAFGGDRVRDVKDMPVALPALRARGEKQTFMDLHVTSESGAHYIVEMQSRRHVMFDERALFYARSTYARQLSEKQLREDCWFYHLKPVIALQVLNYDSNKIRGIKGILEGIKDTLIQRVKDAPMKDDQFLKHYVVVEKFSAQVIDYLQIIQVELPRAERMKELFPPSNYFTEQEWWLSILRRAEDYAPDEVEDLHSKNVIPLPIYEALMRLDQQRWNPDLVREYEKDVIDRERYSSMFAAEREEGREEGREAGREEGETNMVLNMFDCNLPVEQIAFISKRSIEDVSNIVTSMREKRSAHS